MNQRPELWFATRGGARVVVKPDPKWRDDAGWECLGCGAANTPLLAQYARGQANEHASKCWSAVGPISPEVAHLSTVCKELAAIATAMQELTATMAKVADPVAEAARALPDIANAISDVPDHGTVLADVATGVESLVSAVDDQPRWFWSRRRSARRGVST